MYCRRQVDAWFLAMCCRPCILRESSPPHGYGRSLDFRRLRCPLAQARAYPPSLAHQLTVVTRPGLHLATIDQHRPPPSSSVCGSCRFSLDSQAALEGYSARRDVHEVGRVLGSHHRLEELSRPSRGIGRFEVRIAGNGRATVCVELRCTGESSIARVLSRRLRASLEVGDFQRIYAQQSGDENLLLIEVFAGGRRCQRWVQ